MRSNRFILIVLLLMENANSEIPSVEAVNSANKLLYYNFMQDFLTYMEGKMAKRGSCLLTHYGLGNYNKVVVLQKIGTMGDAYITSTIPFGRFLGGRNSPFMDYLDGDMYKKGDVLQSTFFPFYNFLMLANREKSVHLGKDAPTVSCTYLPQGGSECGLPEGKLQFTTPSQKSGSDEDRLLSSDNFEDSNSSGETLENLPSAFAKRKEPNDVLYINAKPPFVSLTNGTRTNKKIRETFFKLLVKFYNLISRKNLLRKGIQGETSNPPNEHYHLYLFLLYIYSSLLRKNEQTAIENYCAQNESLRISRGNIQTYVPIYVHE
eukprot:XP_002259689.1 hypothetical protein, conserved in Plasmodium species [Plasmodium knowlesi strain H]